MVGVVICQPFALEVKLVDLLFRMMSVSYQIKYCRWKANLVEDWVPAQDIPKCSTGQLQGRKGQVLGNVGPSAFGALRPPAKFVGARLHLLRADPATVDFDCVTKNVDLDLGAERR